MGITAGVRAGAASGNGRGLDVLRVSKAYGRLSVLKGLSFTLKPGEALGICGPNGSGKTTLTHLLASLLKPDEGEILLSGVSSLAGLPYREQIGLVPQQAALSPRLTVEQNLHFWAAMRGLGGAERREAVREAAGLARLQGFLGVRVSRCSGGMVRRANLAAGLLGLPALILLDEPTAGVDEENRRQILRTVTALRDAGRMLVLVSHYREELQAVCSGLLFLDGDDPAGRQGRG